MPLMLCACLSERGELMCRAALATGDFEAAAEHVSKYLQLDKQFSDVTDELDSHQLQEQRAVGLFCYPRHTLHVSQYVCRLPCEAWTCCLDNILRQN